MDSHIAAQGTASSAAVWITSPAQLRFEDYRDRCLWGAPNPMGTRSCLDPKLAAEPFRYFVRQKRNLYPDGKDPKFGLWRKALESGRSYMTGDSTPMAQFLRRHSSRLNGWQRLAYRWCLVNPSECLVLHSKEIGRSYEVRKRGEYVEIVLPYRGFGGEKLWITRDGKTKVLINVD